MRFSRLWTAETLHADDSEALQATCLHEYAHLAAARHWCGITRDAAERIGEIKRDYARDAASSRAC